MREENLRFMKYCEMNRKEEEDREKDLERIVNEEVEKKWAHTMEQYKLEREARKQLLANVMKTRQEQIEERSKLTVYCPASNSSSLIVITWHIRNCFYG